ncbi:MAG: helix-turn-helix domain-containing protein [Candidatus Bathyarchaeota archaeon]|nr:helix-turn-helix domain-containing protein [Candidatus Bathyarchaeota archaeon]
MPVRKMKVEVYDESGNRYVISFEGRITKEKAQKVFDMIELLGGIPVAEPPTFTHDLSKIEKVLFIVKKNFPISWFSAREAQDAYEKEIGEPISLSAISTYLSRLAERGIIIKKKDENRIFFKLVPQEMREIIKPFKG